MGKTILIHYQSNQSKVMRNKTLILQCLPLTLPFFLGSAPELLTFSPPSNAGRWGMGLAGSSSHIVASEPSSSGEGFLRVFPCSRMGSLPWDTVLYKLLWCEYFPQWTFTLWVLHRVLSFRKRLLHRGFPTGSPVLMNLLQCGLPSVCGFAGPARTFHMVTISFEYLSVLV